MIPKRGMVDFVRNANVIELNPVNSLMCQDCWATLLDFRDPVF